MTIFTHRTVDLPKGSIKISPSSLYKFFSKPDEWYKEQLLGETTFKGNTASFIGTICHYIFEQETIGNKVTRDDITEQLRLTLLEDPELALTVNISEVQADYPKVAAAVMNEYVIPHNRYEGIMSEIPLVYCLDEEYKIYLTGTCDRIEGNDTVVDFKTTSKKPSDIFPLAYKMQLLAYAYLCNKIIKNMHIDKIRLVYGVRPTLTLDARCFVFTQSIEDSDWKNIENLFELIVDTIKFVKQYPQHKYIVFKDIELKDKV